MPEPRFETLTPEGFLTHESAFLEIAADVPGEYWARDNFLFDLPKKWALSYAVWHDVVPIGYAVLSNPAPQRAHLHHFMIHKDYRGGGLGGKMIQECARRCEALRLSLLTLKVHVENQRGLLFYQRHGFELSERRGDYLELARDVTFQINT